ncbi:DNA-processing protein DprA [Pseudomonas sp. G34]|uniref:DNA-processing protein DprA n=1 Tax=Pseudomonas sp. G34 TaxID=3059083 RepID=UPI002809776B|nr:DNA-processing protein DprA [Pseudomonas sp. G34]MDQ7984063.1 DNA-processing protein DprA [Pseudomonas sp. G34]
MQLLREYKLMEFSAKTEKTLFLSALPGVGAKTLLSLKKLDLEIFNTPTKELLSFLPMIKKKMGHDDLLKAEEYAKRNIDKAHEMGHKILTIFDHDYPELLENIPDAPPILFCSGNTEILNKKSLAIIGTREPTEHGAVIAERVTAWFTERGWTIVSGLAKGIDSIAHKTCLENNGKTAAVLAHGLEKVYPAENKALATEITMTGGLLVSEYAYNTPTFKTNFVQRDRVQAALSAAVTLIQTDIKGGSLHASKAALKYKRNLIVVGQSQYDIETQATKSQGNLRLLSEGKGAFLDLFNDSKLEEELLIKMFSKREYESAERKVIETLALSTCAPNIQTMSRSTALI